MGLKAANFCAGVAMGYLVGDNFSDDADSAVDRCAQIGTPFVMWGLVRERYAEPDDLKAMFFMSCGFLVGITLKNNIMPEMMPTVENHETNTADDYHTTSIRFR